MKITKKISLLFSLILMFMFVGIINAKATTLTFDKTNVKVGGTFSLSYSDVTENNYKLEYDNTYIQMTNSNNSMSGSYLVPGNGTLSFKTQSLTLTEDRTITVKIVKDDTGMPEIASASIVIKANKIPTTTTTVPPTTTTTTQAAKSNNANLKTLEITGSDDSNVVLSPNFSSGVYDYSATVDASVKTITINATMEDPKSNMVISNNATNELKAGENNKITITVTAEDGTKKAYVINIMREALTADATLKSLIIKESKSFELKENKFSYDVKIDDSVTKLTIDYVTSDENSTVSISGNEDLKDGSKVKILVTAEDGTKKEYVLTIVKSTKETKKATPNIAAEKSPLIIMGLSMIAFGLIGGIVYVIKK